MTTTKEDQIHAEFNAWVFNPNSEGYPLPNPHSAMASWKACAESYENKLAEKDEQITALQMGWNECIDKLSEAVAADEREIQAKVQELSEEELVLAKFYAVSSRSELIIVQHKHIEKLQEKLPQTQSLYTQRVREG